MARDERFAVCWGACTGPRSGFSRNAANGLQIRLQWLGLADRLIPRLIHGRVWMFRPVVKVSFSARFYAVCSTVSFAAHVSNFDSRALFFFSLRRFGRLSDNSIKARRKSIRYSLPVYLRTLWPNWHTFFRSFQKKFGLWPKNDRKKS